MKKENAIKIVEVCASYSRKINTGNFQSQDVFCSHKEECLPEKAVQTYKRLFEFCKTMVDNEAIEIIKSLAEPIIEENEAYYPKPIQYKEYKYNNPPSSTQIVGNMDKNQDQAQRWAQEPKTDFDNN